MEWHIGKGASVPPKQPFYSGDGRNWVLADDIFGVITPNTPPARSLGWRIWHHTLSNAGLQCTNWWARPVTSIPRTGIHRYLGLMPSHTHTHTHTHNYDLRNLTDLLEIQQRSWRDIFNLFHRIKVQRSYKVISEDFRLVCTLRSDPRSHSILFILMGKWKKRWV